MITAKAKVDDKVKGLDYGADDYLTKPFETQELIARIRVVIINRPVIMGNNGLTKTET